MMRRSGSLFAKYCHRNGTTSSGSRHLSFGSRKDLHPELVNATPEEVVVLTVRALMNITVGIIRSVGTKGTIAYLGYKSAFVNSPFDPQKYLAELESLMEQKQLVDEGFKELDKKLGVSIPPPPSKFSSL